MATWLLANDLHALAAQVTAKRNEVSHIEPDEVLFLWELELKPKAIARCYRIGDHPMGFFTDKKYCIVFYCYWCDNLNPNQLTILMLHELMHIPAIDNGKLVDHTIKDFATILGFGLDWNEPGQEVPDILA